MRFGAPAPSRGSPSGSCADERTHAIAVNEIGVASGHCCFRLERLKSKSLHGAAPLIAANTTRFAVSKSAPVQRRCSLTAHSTALRWASSAPTLPRRSLRRVLVNGGDGRAAHGSGLEPRVDETVEIGQLIDRVAANLFVGDWPASKGVGLDRLAQPPARVSRRLGSS